MADILGGLVLVNGTDIWTEYGVFLVEDRRGGMENLSAILTPSKTKKETAVDIREEDGEKYSAVLTPRNEARDVTLHFALYNKTKAGWISIRTIMSWPVRRNASPSRAVTFPGWERGTTIISR